MHRDGGIADKLGAGAGIDVDLVVVGRHDLDVDQLRKLVDIGIALVLQRGRRRVLRRHQAELAVERRDLLHRVVRLLHGVGKLEFGLAAQRLDVGGHPVQGLRELLTGR